METWMKADIFFFVATACFAIITILLAVILIRVAILVVMIKRLVRMMGGTFEGVSEEAKELFERIKSNPFFKMFFPGQSKTVRRKKR